MIDETNIGMKLLVVAGQTALLFLLVVPTCRSGDAKRAHQPPPSPAATIFVGGEKDLQMEQRYNESLAAYERKVIGITRECG